LLPDDMLSFDWNQRGGVVTFSNLFLRRRDALQAENDRLRREWASPTAGRHFIGSKSARQGDRVTGSDRALPRRIEADITALRWREAVVKRKLKSRRR
jgi:hypothetical protein